MRLAFWNVGNAPASLVGELARETRSDVVALAEDRFAPAELLAAMNQPRARWFLTRHTEWPVTLLTAFDPAFLQPVATSDRVAYVAIRRPNEIEITLALVHLWSRRSVEPEEAADLATRIARKIDDVETRLRHHRRTVVLGDLNMNPFDGGLVSAEAFHAVMDRRIASRGSRDVKGMERPMFYNPMWGRMGDTSVGPPGTFHRSKGGVRELFWHTIDQVLLRPDLVDRFDAESLQIVTDIGPRSLLGPSGAPDARACSDHLPLTFVLDLREERTDDVQPVG